MAIATWSECLWVNAADGTAVASTASEAGLLQGLNDQPVLLPPVLLSRLGRNRLFKFLARGVFSNTGTPTLIFQLRLGTTAGATQYGGSSLAVSAAITTQSGISNKLWSLEVDFSVRTPGIGTNNCTMEASGLVVSPSGFASPFTYPLLPTTPDTATFTLATIDSSLTYYLNASVTWSASSASNSITLKHAQLLLLN